MASLALYITDTCRFRKIKLSFFKTLISVNCNRQMLVNFRHDKDVASPGVLHALVSTNPALTRLADSRRILLLQGPVGPFFDRLAHWLSRPGIEVNRVVFQGGDHHDCKFLTPVRYCGTLADWSGYLRALVKRLDIDCLVLFGQSRKYHAVARSYAQAIGLTVVVFEEGYFRPGFVTMELDGVNGHSTTMARYKWVPEEKPNKEISVLRQREIQPDIAPWHFQSMAWHAAMHYAAMRLDNKKFPDYLHHRNDSPLHYAAYWLRSWRRKIMVRSDNYRFQRRLFANRQPYFFVPLQLDSDAQIKHHSPFEKNTNFIIEVMRSFARHAAPDMWLVFRQHPHSRGGRGHINLIQSLAAELNIAKRVHHMVEGDTPDLAEQSAGVVLINSTVGLQAIERGAPLMVMGEAIYKQEGLVFMGRLNEFWRHSHPPRKSDALNFLAQMKNLTQAPASVYENFNQPLRWA